MSDESLPQPVHPSIASRREAHAKTVAQVSQLLKSLEEVKSRSNPDNSSEELLALCLFLLLNFLRDILRSVEALDLRLEQVEYATVAEGQLDRLKEHLADDTLAILIDKVQEALS